MVRHYILLFCYKCGWSLCVLDNDKYYRRRFHRCKYCSSTTSGMGALTYPDISRTFMARYPVVEPVNIRPNIPRSVKRAVFERDGHKCIVCGSTIKLELDHIV